MNYKHEFTDDELHCPSDRKLEITRLITKKYIPMLELGIFVWNDKNLLELCFSNHKWVLIKILRWNCYATHVIRCYLRSILMNMLNKCISRHLIRCFDPIRMKVCLILSHWKRIYIMQINISNRTMVNWGICNDAFEYLIEAESSNTLL